jgi:hypothetical protein
MTTALLDRLTHHCDIVETGNAGGALQNTRPPRFRVIEASVNVPFRRLADAATLAKALNTGAIPEGFAPHLERLLSETPLALLLRFCDRHGIDAATLSEFVASNRNKLALHRPDLEEHLDALVPHP